MKHSIKKGIKGNVSLFDIDGTIVNSSLLFEHYLHLCRVGILKPTKGLKAWVKNKKCDKLITEVANEYQQEVMKLNYNIVSQTAIDTVNRLNTRKFNKEALKLIAKDKEEGTLSILISGSPKYLVKPFAQTLGVKGYGSIYDTEGCTTIKSIKPMWASNFKEDFVNKYLSEATIVRGVGDTKSDYYLLSIAKEKYLINPSKENKDYIIGKMENVIIL